MMMMNEGIEEGAVPPPRGLEKEEPEQAYEDDIPKDDRASATQGDDSEVKDTKGSGKPRDVERE